MFNSLFEEIDELKGSLEFSKRFVSTLKNYREKLQKQIKVAENALASLKDQGGNFQTKTVESILLELKEDAKLIFRGEILQAVRKNREFAFPLFLKALLDVADNSEIYRFRKTGTGRNTRIRANIELEGYAGGLSDWAKGVIETRQEFKISRGPDAQKASELWRDTVYQRGPYSKTIRSRIENSGRPAAFWSLLDKGTTTLASDRGGTAYPSYSTPTNFVDIAESKIEKQFRNTLETALTDTNKSEEELKKELDLARSYLSQIDLIVNEISIELEKNKSLYNNFKKVSTYVDENKLDDVLARIRLGMDVKVTSEGRVELGISSRRRYRPYLSRLQAITEGF